jgi:hypothetical protein
VSDDAVDELHPGGPRLELPGAVPEQLLAVGPVQRGAGVRPEDAGAAAERLLDRLGLALSDGEQPLVTERDGDHGPEPAVERRAVVEPPDLARGEGVHRRVVRRYRRQRLGAVDVQPFGGGVGHRERPVSFRCLVVAPQHRHRLLEYLLGYFDRRFVDLCPGRRVGEPVAPGDSPSPAPATDTAGCNSFKIPR